MATRKKPAPKTRDTTLRHLWLAGLGAVESARRGSLAAANDAADRLEGLKKRAGLMAAETQSTVRSGLAAAREQGGTRAGRLSAEVEARLAPVLVKLGLAPAHAPRPRKTTRKSAAKRALPASRAPVSRRGTGRAGP